MIIFLNEERFLDEAIRSVFAQTYDAWELMLVDDGSTDRSSAIAREYAERHPDRVRYLEHPGHENRGMSASRNLGFEQTIGRYIALLDGDDVWLPNKLTDQVAILGAHPEAAMVYGRTRFWHGWTGAPEHRRRDWWTPLGVEPNQVIAPPLLVTNFLKDENTVVSNCSVLVRREVIEEVGGWENSFRTMYEDMVLWTKVLSRWPVFVSDGSWDLYRQHPGNSGISAAAEGIWDPLGPNTSRRRFLEWMNQYIRQRGITDAALLTTLTEQLEPYHESGIRQLSRRATSIFRRLGVAGWLLTERIRASRVSQKVRTSHLLTRVLGPLPEYLPPVGYVQFGDLRRLEPVSRDCGAERGTPVDRYYVDGFLASHESDIRGRVLEIGGNTYTKRLGGDRVTHAQALIVEPGTSALVQALMEYLVDDSCRFDCVLLPQTLHFVYNISAAIRSTHTVLAPGGVVLATFPGISQLSRNRDADSQCWGFTSRSARLTFEEAFSPDSVSVVARGNVLASIALMQGLAAGELTANELDHVDPAYEVIIGVRASRTTHPA